MSRAPSERARKARADHIARYPVTIAAAPPPPDLTDPADLFDPDDPEDSLIAFDPVPRQRQRRNGWTDVTRRTFILLLARCGSITRAARWVGMSTRSVYRLRDAPGADGFAEAWDMAIAMGIDRVRADAMDRALNGTFVPVYRKGKLVRVEHRHCDRLAIALLGGEEQSIAESHRSAMGRRRYWEAVRVHDAHKALEKKLKDEETEKVAAMQRERPNSPAARLASKLRGPRVLRL